MIANKILSNLSIKEIFRRLNKYDNEISQLSNPNLLINGDFQVNQRGETLYESFESDWTKVYTVDRWFIQHGVSLTVNEDGSVTVSNTSGVSGYFMQTYEKPLDTNFRHVTSIKCSNVVGAPVMLNTQLVDGVNKINTYNSETCYISMPPGSSVTVHWIKVERGSVFTPFVPRLYGEELALCQRYFLPYKNRHIVALVEHSMSGSKIYFRVDHINKMRIIPTVIHDIDIVDVYNNGITYHSVVAVGVYATGDITMKLNDFNLSATHIACYFGAEHKLWLDAEIY